MLYNFFFLNAFSVSVASVCKHRTDGFYETRYVLIKIFFVYIFFFGNQIYSNVVTSVR